MNFTIVTTAHSTERGTHLPTDFVRFFDHTILFLYTYYKWNDAVEFRLSQLNNLHVQNVHR